ncbi:MAG TPA: periplasmic heavy metal sensor [Vicinamibacterales bacterium]|nr:periplasmic heavy metal sensor [Vicinamibacterales bacterium]
MRSPARLLICLGLSLSVLGWPAPSSAQGFKWWQNDQFRTELVLTDEQVGRLDETFQALQPTLRTQKDTLDKLESKLSAVLSDPRADEASVLAAAERTEAARSELSKSRTLLTFRMRRILTTDQNVTLKTLYEQWARERRNRPSPQHRDPGGR